MIKVETDKPRNLVVVTYRGHVNRAEAQQKLLKVIAALEGMEPGFRLLTDFSELESMDYACAPEIEATMDLLRKKGVAEVVRVVPDPRKDIGFAVMSQFHYGHKTPVLTVDSRAEALQKLSA